MNKEQQLASARIENSHEMHKYIDFMHKDIRAKYVALPRAFRSDEHKLFAMLKNRNCVFDPHNAKYVEIGNTSRLVDMLRENERNICFRNEALLRTYPTKYLISRFKKFCKSELPLELISAKFGQLYGNDENGLIIDDIVLSDAHKEISPQVRFAIPVYSDVNAKKRLELRNKFDSIAFAAGYYFSSAEEYEYKQHIGLKSAVTVIYVMYEAKYSYFHIDLKGNLYHTTAIQSLHKINKFGLIVKSQSNEFSYQERIFLFNDIDYKEILKYGQLKAEQKHSNEFAVLKINSAKLIKHKLYKSGVLKLYRDPAYSDENSPETEQTALFTYSNIPRELIDNNILIYDINADHCRKAVLSEF